MNDQITNHLGVDDASDRPLVTFALFAYNQEKYIREALEGAFAQTYSPLEIILSDDNSTDGTFNKMARALEEYKGPHRIVLNRNPKNLNIGDHVNTVAKLAKGNLVVLAAGDDISRPDRTEILVERWLKNDCPPAVLYSDFEPIDSDSQPVVSFKEAIYRGTFNKFEMARGNIHVLGATTAIAKCVFSEFPLINSSVRHEDRVLPFRALLLGGKVEFVDEKLIRYRVDGGISRGKALTARHYLFEYLPAWANRTLPDAIQRLADLEIVEPNNEALRRLCEITIAEQNMYIELPLARWLGVEAAFLKGISRGVRFGPLIKLYLKRRFLPFFSFYFNSKNAQ